MIQADSVGGMREHLAWSGYGFKILVREEDATAARDILAPPATLKEDEEILESDFQNDPNSSPS
jgi:hypothetical protein